MDFLNGLVIGVHLLSAHSQAGMNNENPGLYVRAQSGLTAGFYRNSLERQTSYAGWTFETENKVLALSVVGASGYRPGVQVIPMLSAHIPLATDLAARVGYVPKPPGLQGSHVLHLMVEWTAR